MDENGNTPPEPESPRDHLLRSASEGDQEAIARLAEQYLPGLRGYISNKAGWVIAGKESCSDLAQSVCREALQGLSEGRFEFRGDAAFRQWMYQAADHKILNRNRYWSTKKRDVQREELAGDREWEQPMTGIPHEDPTPSVAIIREETKTRLGHYLNRLPPQFREIIRLVHFESLSHKEASLLLGIEEAHSRVLLSRALARLATLCTEEDQDPSQQR